MIITYAYINIQSWDKERSTQHEMAIQVSSKRKRAIKWLKCLKSPFLTTREQTLAADEYIRI